MNKFFLQGKAEFSVDSESKLDGKASGVVYSGGIIKRHGPFENLIIDLSTTTIAKSKTPLLKDHLTSQVAGHGQLAIEDHKLVLKEGLLSKKTAAGIEIRDLAEEGFDWEMSMGIFGFTISDVLNETINGQFIEKGTVFRHGVVREASFVPLGADMNTSASVFNYQQKEENSMELTKEQWAEFACSCGGTKDSTKEDVKKKFADNEKKIKDLEDENKKLKAQFEVSQAEVEKVKVTERSTKIKEALSAKKITLSDEQVSTASKTEESTSAILAIIDGMKVEKQIEEKFSKTVTVSTETEEKTKENPEEIRLKAEALVKEGKAADFLSALDMLEGK